MPIKVVKFMSLDGKMFDNFEDCVFYEEENNLVLSNDEKATFLSLYELIMNYLELDNGENKELMLYLNNIIVNYLITDETLTTIYYLLKLKLSLSNVTLDYNKELKTFNLKSGNVVNLLPELEKDLDYSISFEPLKDLEEIKSMLHNQTYLLLKFFINSVVICGNPTISYTLDNNSENSVKTLELVNDIDILREIDMFLTVENKKDLFYIELS